MHNICTSVIPFCLNVQYLVKKLSTVGATYEATGVRGERRTTGGSAK